MTLDKAIKDIQEIMDIKRPLKAKDYFPCLKLGIKAIERLQWLRSRQVIFCDQLLEGETPGEKGEVESGRK